MFNKDIEKLNFIVENISNIEEIIKRHDGIFTNWWNFK